MSSTWSTIESSLVSELAAIEADGSPILATTRGSSLQDRKALVTSMQREHWPVCYVVLSLRSKSDEATQCPGDTRVRVLIGCGSVRTAGDARIGAVDGRGVFEVKSHVAQGLKSFEPVAGHVLRLREEKLLDACESFVVWEQQYAVRQTGVRQQPTFGGELLAGALSDVTVLAGSVSRATSVFSFPGIDGVFQRDMGTRERGIAWAGHLRAAGDEAMNTLESSIESAVQDGSTASVVDEWNRTYESCVLMKFKRIGPRVHDDVTGEAVQQFELHFSQLQV